MNTKIYFLLLIIIASWNCKTSQTSSSSADQKPVAKDRIEEVTFRDFRGNPIEQLDVATIKYQYLDNNLVNTKYYNLAGALIDGKGWKKNAECRYEFDDRGNYTKRTVYDSDGNIVDTDGWGDSAIEIFTYSDKNQLIKRANYNKEGNLLGLGDLQDAYAEYGYNKNGMLEWKKSYRANGKLITNGFCISTFEYDQDNRLSKHIYKYNDDKIRAYTIFKYENGKVIAEEEFDADQNKLGYALYGYQGDRLISEEKWYHKWKQPIMKEEEIDLKINGWKLSSKDLKSLAFKTAGKGEYIISVDENGAITDMVPIKYKGAIVYFEQELFEKFKNIKLEKDKTSSEVAQEGSLNIQVLHQKLGIFMDLDKIQHPAPETHL